MFQSKWIQVGVTWSGTNCTHKPSVYTLVSKYAHWIQSVTKYKPSSYCTSSRSSSCASRLKMLLIKFGICIYIANKIINS
ncbi:hypothetical protein B4U79_10344 [Dinothrombium tinctorium]|uniref:Peptidase S1 domain-containing protein n=1 Tax=Dinothrombium tinctorium TaxID=1965070 RepID=A0A3S3RTM2_9ACAR|nr:hypothetical protein B4U79_10344 [Dinothrombium tinctorium]